MEHLDEAKKLWAEIVPKSGQANTQQGEMLRASKKLRDSWRAPSTPWRRW